MHVVIALMFICVRFFIGKFSDKMTMDVVLVLGLNQDIFRVETIK